MSKTTNPWDLAWSKWWVQQNYKKCEVDEMTLSEALRSDNNDMKTILKNKWKEINSNS